MLTTLNLRSYVSAAESTRSIDPSLLEMQSIVGRIRGQIDQAVEGDHDLNELASDLAGDASRLSEIAKRRPASPSSELDAPVAQLDGVLRELRLGERPLTGIEGNEWATRTSEILNSIDGALRELRRQANVGASTS